jgi:O-antigen ligase
MPSGGEGGHPLWRSKAARLVLAALPLWITFAAVFYPVPSPIVPWSIKGTIAVVFALTCTAPASGLLLTAVLVPFGDLFAVLVGLPAFRISEAIVVAFLAGWLLRGEEVRSGPRIPTTLAWLLGALVVSSIAGQAWRMGFHAVDWASVVVFFDVYYLTGERIGFIAGAHVLEALALAAATVMLFRQCPRLAVTLPAALVASAVVAAAASLLLYAGIGPAAAIVRDARFGFRAAHLPDVNAAGSYFGMALCLALGMAARARGWSRVSWAAGAVAAFAGLRVTESRSALAAVVIFLSLGVVWAATARQPLRLRAAAFGALLCAMLAMAYVQTRMTKKGPIFGADFRQQFNATSVRMIRAHPLFGVGIGQYYLTSSLFLSPELAWRYGFENAHNYFLQIGAELGVAGLVAFAAWIGVVLARSARAIEAAPRDSRLLGAAAGVAAVCVTCLTGHPLLVDEVAFPFWMQFALTAGLAGSVLWQTAKEEQGASSIAAIGRRPWMAAALAGTVIFATAFNAAQPPLTPAASAAVDGFYEWDTAEDGTRFRWTGEYASLFVPGDVRAARIPMRMPASARAVTPIGVEVMSGALSKGRVIITDVWAEIYVPLGDVPAPKGYRRVDLRVDRAWQPAVYIPGSADLRNVGVQVGEPRLDRVR